MQRTIGRLGLAAALLAGMAVSGPATAAAPVKKLLVVGMDGLNWDNVVAAAAPNLDALAAQGLLATGTG
ncbi:hypothetical protein BJY16_008384 [Actinoplanes octamycinicus]|uniref:Type I phosphodiesterase/nucleotide pyrophosphatase n=1 Tax=Actinoplanes octamycinicus TaxID=135948 RepID=A0A7W7H6I2_9ACTN|nr:hypothetical protein [Actinoplanes octamycinicus]MBB4744925.1 hypothetical protein [Actinoplanes octamycinicus]GIE55510.1 hypothetical protein Aoc01nite_09120 [Actinoplanes octamycinicus]